MPTNANVFNSRVTSEALEKKFRDVFPAQGGAELVQDLYASGVITPVIDFSSVAEGSFLPTNLQTAWDFSTAHYSISNATTTVINTTGFWKFGLTYTQGGNSGLGNLVLTDGFSGKTLWRVSFTATGTNLIDSEVYEGVVFVNSGQSVTVTSSTPDLDIDFWSRQIADVNGNLTNPTGFTFS